MYIVDSEQIENIYNQIKDFEIYSFEGETIIDPAYDIGDILVIEGKKVLFQGELEYAGKFKANIKSKIQAKTEQESMQTKESNSNKIRRIQSELDQTNGKILQLAQETTENTEKLTQHEQTIDSISDKVQSNTTNINNNYQDVLGKLGDCAQKSDVETISKSVETIQTDSKYAIEIAQEIQQNGVTKVKTSMGYTFDDNGLNIEKTGAETKTVLNEKGLDVKDNTGSSSESLLFAGFDKSTGETVVKSKNMTVEKYLVIGKYSRIEDFTEDGEKGTGFFWIGG